MREAMARKDPPWNQSDLARSMGVHRVMVSKYLNGERCPGLDVVEKFADALNVEPSELLVPAREKVGTR